MMLIGIAGGTGSGKTTVVNKIANAVPKGSIARVSQDAYYKDNKDLPPEERKQINFDHPNSIDWDLLIEHLKLLLNGQSIDMPVYSFLTSTRAKETITVVSKPVIIVEGILILVYKAIRDLCTMKIFVDAPSDERLIRVIERDLRERGRDVNEVLARYLKTVKPMHEQFIEPSKRHADIIVPQGGSNKVAINLLASMVLEKLEND